MVFEVDLAFFRRDGEEMGELRGTKGTLAVGPEGSTLAFPECIAPETVWMVEIRRRSYGVGGAPVEAELVSA